MKPVTLQEKKFLVFQWSIENGYIVFSIDRLFKSVNYKTKVCCQRKVLMPDRIKGDGVPGRCFLRDVGIVTEQSTARLPGGRQVRGVAFAIISPPLYTLNRF